MTSSLKYGLIIILCVFPNTDTYGLTISTLKEPP